MTEAWLEHLPEAMPDGLVITRNSDGVVLYANPAFARIMGASQDDVIGKPALDFYHRPDDRKRLLDAVANDGGVEGMEILAKRADGKTVWVEACAKPIQHRGEPALIAILFDITRFKESEARVREQAEKISDMARFPEMNPGPVCRTDLDGNILLANLAARELFGPDVVGQSWLKVCPEMTPNLWKVITEGTACVRHEADIEDVCLVFSHNVVKEFVFIYGTDITQQKKAERQIAEQAQALRDMARFPEMNPGPVLRMDHEGRILLANRAAKRVFSRDPTGARWFDLCPGLTNEIWQKTLATTDIVPLEARVGKADYVFAHRRAKESEFVFVFGADVTLQKAAEIALRDTEKMATLGTLAAGVAHELNNPAAATRRGAEQLKEAFAKLQATQLDLAELPASAERGAALAELDELARTRAKEPVGLEAMERSDLEAEIEEWLDERNVDNGWELAPTLVNLGYCHDELNACSAKFKPEELGPVLNWLGAVFPVYSLFQEIGQGASRISEIVTALKSYSFLGKAPVQAVDVREGLDNTLIILRNKLKVGIKVKREYADDLPTIEAQGTELNQAWTNIIDNAADAMGGEGNIVIRAYADNGAVVVEIEDDGPGMPKTVKARIFEPFFTTKEPGKGTGLGLATTHSIVTKKHGGEIKVESSSKGTKFTVRLPSHPSKAAGRLQPDAAEDAAFEDISDAVANSASSTATEGASSASKVTTTEFQE